MRTPVKRWSANQAWPGLGLGTLCMLIRRGIYEEFRNAVISSELREMLGICED
ncbi:MAG: hypothetical protein KDA80_24100 [Planctomycetaceae bacterium]|nr:hypothetical protein [Planctomycetaceae bacterium]